MPLIIMNIIQKTERNFSFKKQKGESKKSAKKAKKCLQSQSVCSNIIEHDCTGASKRTRYAMKREVAAVCGEFSPSMSDFKPGDQNTERKPVMAFGTRCVSAWGYLSPDKPALFGLAGIFYVPLCETPGWVFSRMKRCSV